MKRISNTREGAVTLTVLLVLVAGLLFAGLARAAMVKLSMQELVEASEAIVLGQVISLKSDFRPGTRYIYTDVEVEVELWLWPKDGPRVLPFQVAGGVVGELGMRTSTDAVPEEQDFSIVFVRGGAVLGGHQGYYKVTEGNVEWDDKIIPLGEFIQLIRNSLPQ